MDRLKKEKLSLGMEIKNFSSCTNTVLTAQENVIARLFADYFNKNFDAYDRAIDSVYNLTHVGGSRFHHLVDGQHTILGALRAVNDVSSNDSFFTEFSQATEHLFRDAMSVSGINPILNFSPKEFEVMAKVAKQFGVTKPMLADALTFNAPELLGGLLGISSLVLFSKTKDESKISELSASYLISSLVSLNPILFPVAAYKLVLTAKNTENKLEVLKSSGKGAIISGTSIAVSSLFGGPIWFGCIASVGATIAVRYAVEKPEKAFTIIENSANIAKQYILKVKNIRLGDEFNYVYR